MGAMHVIATRIIYEIRQVTLYGSKIQGNKEIHGSQRMNAVEIRPDRYEVQVSL